MKNLFKIQLGDSTPQPLDPSQEFPKGVEYYTVFSIKSGAEYTLETERVIEDWAAETVIDNYPKTFEEAIIQAAGNMIIDWSMNYIGYFNRQEEALLTELTQFLEEEEEL